MTGLTYKGSGVDYDAMDPFKKLAQQYARETDLNVRNGNLDILEWTRGESVTVFQHLKTKEYIGHVHEGLGTKNLVSDVLAKLTGIEPYYRSVAIDTVAMIVNDMITLGVHPSSLTMHLSVGESSWFDDLMRSEALLMGFRDGCNLAEAVWAGGETPTLKGIIMPGTCELSGSAFGMAHEIFDPVTIEDGDRIIVFESSGIHANGLTAARKLAGELSQGYLTPVPGTYLTYGEALLTPTHIYVEGVKWAQYLGAKIKYGINITGHGWRKLMRAKQPWKYVMDKPIAVPPVLSFIQKAGKISDEEMYGNFNMGAGFAIIVSDKDADRILGDEDMKALSFQTFLAGRIERSDKKQVEIPWKGLVFEEETLDIR
jgi:phosphoribosylformylglycinamidine cyclo-ligase